MSDNTKPMEAERAKFEAWVARQYAPRPNLFLRAMDAAVAAWEAWQARASEVEAAAGSKGAPVAWGIAYRGELIRTTYQSEADALKELRRRNTVYPDEAHLRQLVALYAHPQEPPKAGEERESALPHICREELDELEQELCSTKPGWSPDIDAFQITILLDLIAAFRRGARNGADHEVSKPDEQKDAAAHPLPDAWMGEAERLLREYAHAVSQTEAACGMGVAPAATRERDVRDTLLAHLRSRVQPDALADRLKMEAQIHAQEARTANATIAEIYQLVTGATGEHGNWHGAEPVRQYIAAQEARLRQALAALELARRDGRPDAFYATTDEQIDAAISSLREAIGEKT